MNSSKIKFYQCKGKSNLVYLQMHPGSVQNECENALEEAPSNAKGSAERHLPVITVTGNTAKVHISVQDHPMVDAHYIEWIFLETNHGGKLHWLPPGDKPEAEFCLSKGEKVTGADCFCNLHGLWRKEL
ncbi:MAG: desulfoferrodoxin [Clostridiales bacterium]|jgi:superoxide reductase|nr:desulfoferrodoxin [Clostridiales bacterium]MCI1961681.1 desulfoferrodoxin [Clostridiales bacterium]MCI2021910.1 desulfoferrodoxin [Clostridiales bacterium]MCI2026075.1 desulfoferrodoxin [Clostridiales bacterium]